MRATADPVAPSMTLTAPPVRVGVLLAAAGLAWALSSPLGDMRVPEQQTVLVGAP